MNYNKLPKGKHMNKHLKTKSWFRGNPNIFDKKQSTKTNFLHFMETCKRSCKGCSLTLTPEEKVGEHLFAKKHKNVVNNKSFCNINCCRKVNQIHKMSQGKQSLLCKKKYGIDSTSETLPIYKNLAVKEKTDSILSTVIKSEKMKFPSNDLSIYRTPSGKYYCQSCNLSVNSQSQFLQHTESRKHKQKANKPSYKLK